MDNLFKDLYALLLIMKPQLIDIHCHIDICKNISQIIENAKTAEVGVIVNNGVDIKSNRKTLELSEKYSAVK